MSELGSAEVRKVTAELKEEKARYKRDFARLHSTIELLSLQLRESGEREKRMKENFDSI